MSILEQADMLKAVKSVKFQFKNGAAFSRGDDYDSFDFREKFSSGWGTTFEVQRDRFDKILADEAQSQGVEIRFGHSLTGYESAHQKVRLTILDETGKSYQAETRFVLDASGFGRVLPRLLNLERPSRLVSRTSKFTHVQDNISDGLFDHDKILITVHAKNHKDELVKRKICSVLAGYVWDTTNPYVKNSARIDTLAEICRIR